MYQKTKTNQKERTIKSFTKLICILFLFCFTIQTSNAQVVTNNKEKQSIKKENIHKPDVKKNKAIIRSSDALIESKSSSVNLPYYNYKGISDINAAKLAWAADYPEEFNKLNEQLKSDTKYTLTQTQETTNTKTQNNILPNSERILPKNYDDSKTNNKNKNQ